MTSIYDRPIDTTSDASLLDAFTEACAQHGISPDGDDGCDLATILNRAFDRGITSKDALSALVLNLVTE
ncbi:hypothetical protein [Agrobacterium vitis]|uniref:Uncharacterized protein n=1 Tax=Agrobacterium vitis TaxID=373 RepID=A0A7K1RF65_AGRVI|nr:hypothetical protein [Agrobacterium vitis]MVA56641.1 hypothetical protein [Agrobacterium vitis]